MIILPTLHKRIRRSVLRLVLLFGALGLVLVAGIYMAGREPLQLVRMNYDSVAYARHMERALNAMQLPESGTHSMTTESIARFEQALGQAQGNLTEEQEAQVVASIETAWEAFLSQPDMASSDAVYARIDELIQTNEQGMFARLDRNKRFRSLLMLATAVAFVLGTVWAFMLVDGVAAHVAHPLRRVAEMFRARPELGKPLHLPDPQTLEVRLLFDELSRLWDRLGELDALNVHKLLMEKQKLEVILESVEDAMCVLDANGMVMLVSRQMLQLLNLPSDKVLGLPWRDLSTVSENYRALRDALQDGLQGVREATLSENGEERVYAARRRNLLDPQGVTGQVFLLRDITEKRRRDNLRTEMMDWISHELKTPIQSLGLAADLLSRRPQSDEDMQMLVDTVVQDSARLRTVARQFMDIARMSPTVLQLAPEAVDLVPRIQDWLAPFRLVARESGQTLEFVASAPAIVASVDSERLAWALGNLVSNAQRAGSPGVLVRVSLGCEGRTVSVRVEDSGPGLPKELEARLFEPFSHRGTAGSRTGMTGLGLAITRDIVEAHGGGIHYTPREGGGSVFILNFPLVKSVA